MATQSFLVTALPRSVDPNEQVHVSLFVSHRLTPDGAEGVVADFPGVVDWPAELAGARIALNGHLPDGTYVEIPVTADLSPLDSATWTAVFPPQLAVRGTAQRDFTDVPWRTFPAHRMQQHSLLAHAAGMFSSPIDAPGVVANPLTRPVFGALGIGQFPPSRLRIEHLFDPEIGRFDERATRYLDDVTGQGYVGGGVRIDADAQPLGLVVQDAHRALRYYQRPEEQRPYREQPDPDAKPAPLRRPDPEFHERASTLGDQSALLRRLGLVIDLHIDDLGTLAGVVDLQADIAVPDIESTIVQPRTACRVDGTRFFAPSATGDYDGPLVRLGDEERYTVLDLDPDAQGLKLEHYLRTLVRLAAAENNGDPVTSAPHALRAIGFSVARNDRAEQLHDRLDGAPARADAIMNGTAPPLNIEDITRGVRLEVWDDASGVWHSLHRRRIDVAVDGLGTVLGDVPDTGFLQGASLTRADDAGGAVEGAPYHAHEVMAGWEGWSLSAPRPGRTIVNVDGQDVVLDAPPVDPDPIHPVKTTTRVAPGTLPWLRYGRAYAFRAWAVDLAGNSSPHTVAGPPDAAPAAPVTGARTSAGPADDVRAHATELAQERLAGIAPDATVAPRVEGATASLDAIRAELRAARGVPAVGPQQGRGAPGLRVEGFAVTGFTDVDRTLRARLADRFVEPVGMRATAAAPRRAAVEAAFADVAVSGQPLLERIDRGLPPTTMADALVASAITAGAFVDDQLVGSLAALADVVTTPRPFLRWSPVVEPVVVPRHPYSEAESQLTLVIRSGVTPPADPTGTVTIVAPDEFAAATIAAHPELDLRWRGDSQRHLLPPKTTQLDAEQFGVFDAAFGSGDADAVRRALATSLRESGNLFDTTVADLTTPGARIAQPGVAFHTSPTAEDPAVTDPADLPRGDAPGRGQYVVHDVDGLVVPYLPDPFATGLTMVFPDAGRDDVLAGLFGVESLTLRYADDWPEKHPVRLVLASGARLHGAVDDDGHSMRIELPPGEQLRFRLSSALDRDHLAWLGLWRSLPPVLQQLDLLAQAAADGWFWWLTPSTEIRLVHAVPRPVELPRPTMLLAARVSQSTEAAIVGGVDVHGPSTERLDLEATWTEWVDDITKPGPEQITVRAAVGHVTVAANDDLVVTGADDADVPLPDGTTLHVHRLVHQLGDTRHRAIDYAYRATTRYREYFDPRTVPDVDDLSVVGPTTTLDVVSTARPPKPIVRDVIPVFRWYTDTEPDQPFGVRRTRRAGLRVYLDRPWYASGDGELLGVVLTPTGTAAATGQTSQWGADPVYEQQGPALRGALPLVDVAHLIGLDDRPEAGRPVGPLRITQLVDIAGVPTVGVLAYQPEYDPERRLWFVDIALDTGTAFWPFVRLAVARLQPHALPGHDLSPVILCEFVAVPPPRTATVSRPDVAHARVVVTGPVGAPAEMASGAGFLPRVLASRVMRARLERRVPEVGTDLGWETVATLDLPVLGIDGTVVSWAGELELPAALAPATPGGPSDLRITLEEWELLPADPREPRGPLTVEARVIYADHIELT